LFGDDLVLTTRIMGSGHNDECDITRNLFQMLREFGRSSERIFLTTDEQARNIESGKVILRQKQVRPLQSPPQLSRQERGQLLCARPYEQENPFALLEAAKEHRQQRTTCGGFGRHQHLVQEEVRPQNSSSDENTTSFGEFSDSLSRPNDLSPMIGMNLAQTFSIVTLHVAR